MTRVSGAARSGRSRAEIFSRVTLHPENPPRAFSDRQPLRLSVHPRPDRGTNPRFPDAPSQSRCRSWPDAVSRVPPSRRRCASRPRRSGRQLCADLSIRLPIGVPTAVAPSRLRAHRATPWTARSRDPLRDPRRRPAGARSAARSPPRSSRPPRVRRAPMTTSRRPTRHPHPSRRPKRRPRPRQPQPRRRYPQSATRAAPRATGPSSSRASTAA